MPIHRHTDKNRIWRERWRRTAMSEMHLFRNSYPCVHGFWRWCGMAFVQAIETRIVWSVPKNMINACTNLSHIHYEMLVKYLLIHAKSVVIALSKGQETATSTTAKSRKKLSKTPMRKMQTDFDVWFFALWQIRKDTILFFAWATLVTEMKLLRYKFKCKCKGVEYMLRSRKNDGIPCIGLGQYVRVYLSVSLCLCPFFCISFRSTSILYFVKGINLDAVAVLLK